MRASAFSRAIVAVLAGWLALAAVPSQAWAEAAAASFAVLKSGAADYPEIAFNTDLTLRLTGISPIDPKKAQLWLDGSPLGVEPRVFQDRGELVFTLARNANNRDLWARLLGSPLAAQKKQVAVGFQYDGKPVEVSKPPKADEAKDAAITLITYNGFLMALGLLTATFAIVVVGTTAWQTTVMRDTIFPQMRDIDRPFSLGRLQMLVWFCLILASFLFIFVVTWDLNSITTESFALMGISGSTALAAVAIDRSKGDAVDAAQRRIEGLGLRTLDDVGSLYTGHHANPNDRARTTIPGAAIPAGEAVAATADPTYGQLMDAYTPLISKYKTDGFLRDLVNDANGPTIHRWQILIWTAVLGVIYIGKVYTNLETPTFGTNLLALMGISGGAYLGFKIPEKS